MYNYWPTRKTHRLKNHNYSSPNSYFITICLKPREEFFGNLIKNKMILNLYGEIIKKRWLDIPSHSTNVSLGKFIVMPDHLHGIINVLNKMKSIEPIERKYQSLPIIISGFKASVTREINILREDNLFKWQKSYYDHIIRNEQELKNIQQYIELNPLIHSRRKQSP